MRPEVERPAGAVAQQPTLRVEIKVDPGHAVSRSSCKW